MAILDLQKTLNLVEAGRADEAIERLAAWAQQMPTHAAVRVALARAYEAVEQWDQACAAWQDAHFLMPNSPAIAEGLARTQAATAQHAVSENRLVMDLDLQAELDATLEALFNPFTLPQPAEASPDPPPVPEEKDETLAQVEAALAAAAEDEDAAAFLDESDDTAEETAEPEGSTQAEYTDDAGSIYDEIEQLIEEKQQEKARGAVEAAEAASEAGEAPPETGEAILEAWPDFDAPTEEDAPPPDDDLNDLERLIHELESARIVPQPELEDIPPPELDDDIEDMVSETLARIYASQGQYSEAARVYEQLALQHPDEADRFHEQATEMRARAGEA